ncbi:MAG: HAD family hydrolase [Opitutales bacterium]|nr:HAD family hydrolase [Opitutales bacterium]
MTIFTDVDGTLISLKTHKLVPSAIEAVKEARANGFKVVAATGRSIAQFKNLGEIEFDGYICMNGGYCQTAAGEIIYEGHIDKSDLARLIEFFKTRKNHPCMFASKAEVFANVRSAEIERLAQILGLPCPEVKDPARALEIPVALLNMFVSPSDEEELMEEVLINCHSSRWTPLFADVNPKSNSKATGMLEFSKYFNIEPSQTFAIGDGENDMPMLLAAGVSVAMGNASGSVKACAHHTTAAVDDGGFAAALRKFGFIK